MNALLGHLEDKHHIIWDWNGTLLRDVDHALKITNRLLEEENLPPIDLQHYREILRFPVIDFYRQLGFDIAPAKFMNLCERFNQHFHAGIQNCSLWPGSISLLASMKAAGKVQSILSASEQNLLESQVKLLAVAQHFDHVTGIADKSAGSKVARGHELMAKVGFPPETTIMIGDTDHDLEVANALGIDIVLVDHGHQSAARLKRAHHTVLTLY